MAHRCTLVPDVKLLGQTKIPTFSHAEDAQEGQKLSWYGRLAAVQCKDTGPEEQKNQRGFKAGRYSNWLPHLAQIKPQLTPAERAGANGSLLPAQDHGAASRRMTTDWSEVMRGHWTWCIFKNMLNHL